MPQVAQQPPEQEKDATDEGTKHSTVENNKHRENKQFKNDAIPQNTQNQYGDNGTETEYDVNKDRAQSQLAEKHYAQRPPIAQQQSSCCIII